MVKNKKGVCLCAAAMHASLVLLTAAERTLVTLSGSMSLHMAAQAIHNCQQQNSLDTMGERGGGRDVHRCSGITARYIEHK